MAGGKLTPQVLANGLILRWNFDLGSVFVFESMQILPNIRYDAADAMIQKPTPSIEAVHPRMETLHRLDRTAALAGSVATPTANVHVERGGALVRPERALSPPVVVFGFLGISGELEGFEELAPVRVLSNLGEILGDQAGRSCQGERG